MSKLKDILSRDISREIEGVIKADDRRRITQDVREYVVTSEIQKCIAPVFEGLKEASLVRGGDIYPFNGVWIFGYFGSGKSHLLKILAYLMDIDPDGDLLREFLSKIDDSILRADVEQVLSLPSRSILFNIDQLANSGADDANVILEVFRKVFDRMLGFDDENPAVAELEYDLDKHGKLEEFRAYYKEQTGRDWVDGRSDVMFLERDTFVEVFSGFQQISTTEADNLLSRYEEQRTLTTEGFAKRVKEWLDRHEDPRFRLNFFVDEVGQFVGNSSRRMLNLQTVAETLATVCENRSWVFVTSQEDLDRVIGDAAAQQRNDFSRITARFHFRVALTSANVEEVIQKRLLDKNDEGMELLRTFYHAEREALRTLFRFGAGGKDIQYKDEEHFCFSYPFPAYQYNLLQQALRGLSDHNAFTGRHVSRGERSMLEVFQHVGKNLAEEPLYRFAGFDRMFDGVRNTLKGGLLAQINTAENELGSGMMLRVLKALLMVKYVQDFRATVDHLVALLTESVEQNVAALRKEVEEALGVLEYKIYVKRDGELYSYLTNEEQDIETEIKQTEVEFYPQRKSIAEVVFDKVLKTRKLMYEARGTEYSFSRLVDDDAYGATSGDLALHVVTHLHPHSGDIKTILNQAMGRKHMLIVLSPSDTVTRDLRLYHQSELWLRQNGTSEDPVRARIIAERRAANEKRYRRLTDSDIPALLEEAQIYVYDSPVALGSRDPKIRIREAFQALISRAYPNLKLLAGRYTEDTLSEIFHPGDETRLLSGAALDLGEDEAEMQAFIMRAHADARNMLVSTLKDEFGAGQYGWDEWAVICVLAKLFMRGAVELSYGATVLESDAAYERLRVNRGHDQITVRPAEKIDGTVVNKLKSYFQEFFHQPAGKESGKDLLTEFATQFGSLSAHLERHLSDEHSFPFLASLRRHHAEYQRLSRLYTDELKNELLTREDELLQAKLEEVDAVLRFMENDTLRETYRDMRSYLERHEANIKELSQETATGAAELLRSYLSDAAPYRNNATKRARDAYEQLKQDVAAMVEARRSAAQEQVVRELNKLQTMPEFAVAEANVKERLSAPLQHLIEEELPAAHLAPVIDHKAHIRAGELLEKAQEELLRLAHPEEKISYAAADEKRIPYTKSELSSADEVAEYAEALRAHYTGLVNAGKRIRL